MNQNGDFVIMEDLNAGTRNLSRIRANSRNSILKESTTFFLVTILHSNHPIYMMLIFNLQALNEFYSDHLPVKLSLSSQASFARHNLSYLIIKVKMRGLGRIYVYDNNDGLFREIFYLYIFSYLLFNLSIYNINIYILMLNQHKYNKYKQQQQKEKIK